MLIFSMTALSAPPARAESVPDCIVGTWGFPDLDGQFRPLVDQLPGAVLTGVSGASNFTIAGDGSFESQTDVAVSIVQDVQGGSVPLVLQFGGYERGTLHEDTPGMLVESITEPALTMTVSSPLPGVTDTSTVALPSVEGVYRYDCAGPSLAAVGTRDGTVFPSPVEFVRL
jgi:hypothetical protein